MLSLLENTPDDECVGWIEALDSQEENLFARILTINTSYKTKGDFRHGRNMAYALVEAALGVAQFGTQINNAEEAVSLAIAKDRRLKRAFYHLGLQLIVNHLNELYVKDHQL